MQWFKQKISDLQQKPYSSKVKILWGTVAAIAIILLVIWFITLRYRNLEASNELSKFAPIFENLKKLKNNNP
ncbi:MAG: hypothetical protein HY396_01850 [Candidatus Doudnabacteria bacterium]|nr:hypothetical protein [Candidatus Doudnabacteria bacterium]